MTKIKTDSNGKPPEFYDVSNWLAELCPEIAEWQIETIAEHIEQVRRSAAEECLTIMQNCDGDLGFAIFKTKKRFGIEE